MSIMLADSMDSDTVVPIVAIVFTFIWLIVKAIMAPFCQKAAVKAKAEVNRAGSLTDEEHASLANLQRTLSNMERRVESLETILIDTQHTR